MKRFTSVLSSIALISLSFFTVLTSTTSQASTNDTCEQKLFVNYTIEQKSMALDEVTNNQNHAFSLQLLRRENQILQLNDESKTSTLWQKLPNKLVKETRYFDQFQRGIEYEPKKLPSDAWQIKAQLIAPRLIEQMSLINETGMGCQRMQHFKLHDDKISLDLWWLPEIQIVKKLKQVTADHQTVWLTQAINTDKNVINRIFEKVQNYQTTDYADIGDNESDSFLAQMINLGFVEHGASGFYNANGQTISAKHSH